MCPASRPSKDTKTPPPAAGSGIKKAARRHWKWLAVAALAVASTMLSCGLSASSTSPICISINKAIALLLLPIATQNNAPANNIYEANTSPLTTLLNLTTCKNSSDGFGNLSNTKSAISIAENMATKTKDLTTTSVYSTINSTTSNYGKIRKDFTPSHLTRWRNYGRSGSQPYKLLTSKRPPTLRDTRSKKLPAKKPMNTTYAATKTAKRSGYFQSTYECLLAEINLAA